VEQSLSEAHTVHGAAIEPLELLPLEPLLLLRFPGQV